MRNREAFEEWYSGAYRETIHILPNGQYASPRQQHSWDAWQARVPEGYVVVPKHWIESAVDWGALDSNISYGDESKLNEMRDMIEAVEK